MEKDVKARFDKTDKRFDKIDKRFDTLEKKIDRIIDVVVVQQKDIGEIKERLTKLEDTVTRMANSIDALTKAVSDMHIEYSAVKIQLARHEAWIKQIAEKNGVELKV